MLTKEIGESSDAPTGKPQMTDVSRETCEREPRRNPTPDGTLFHVKQTEQWLAEVFGQTELQTLVTYGELLEEVGVERGLIGPREVPRLWDRHLLNCAVVADPALGLLPTSASVIDVGSGAGLPGLVWAAVRPDLTVTLVESMLRRTEFLSLAVEHLNLGDRVQVHRARAEDATQRQADVVTARAVAALPKLLPWLAPLVADGGRIVALKGRTASEEIQAAQPVLSSLGKLHAELRVCGQDLLDEPTTVVVVDGFTR